MRSIFLFLISVIIIGCGTQITEPGNLTTVEIRYIGSAQEIYIYENYRLNSIVWTADNVIDTIYANIGSRLEARYLSNPLYHSEIIVSENMSWTIR